MLAKLRKALYGCIESAKLWYDLLSSVLISQGFEINPFDRCVFNKMVGENQVTIIIYVDDLFLPSVDVAAIDAILAVFKDKFKEITIHDGLVHSYLGMTFDFSKDFSVKVTMRGYIRDLLDEVNVTSIVKTPALDNLFQTRDTELLSSDDAKFFHSTTAKLLYVAKRVRPDILLAVSFLTTRVLKPDQDDMNKLRRVLAYLNGSDDLGIVLQADPSTYIKSFVDASYGVHVDGKSHSGLCLSLGAGPFLVKSTRQRIVTKSSTEAELVALSDFASEVISSKAFLDAQGTTTSHPIIYQDNQSTIALVNNGVSRSDRSRHINIRYFWLKERVDNGDVAIEYLPTDDMVADILTKPLQGNKFLYLRQLLLNWKV
jgi:hypothetical protein